jgi:hypothetical protein
VFVPLQRKKTGSVSEKVKNLYCGNRGLPGWGGKISPSLRGNSQATANRRFRSINALNFSSACTTKRFPSSRCASAIQIIRPLESIVETQPKLQPALLSLSAMISQDFTRRILRLLRSTSQRQKCIAPSPDLHQNSARAKLFRRLPRDLLTLFPQG